MCSALGLLVCFSLALVACKSSSEPKKPDDGAAGEASSIGGAPAGEAGAATGGSFEPGAAGMGQEQGGEPGMPGSGGAAPTEPGSWNESFWDEAVWQ